MRRLEPDERAIPDLDPEDWEKVVQWRPLIYKTIKDFASNVIGREVAMRGQIGTPEFGWVVLGKYGATYGVDAVTLCQDLEYRALEAAAVAFHRFDPVKAHGEHVSRRYLQKAIVRALQGEFDRLRGQELAYNTVPLETLTMPNPRTGREKPEPSYLDPHDQDEPGDGLNDEDREALQTALGALTSREAWALRMVADGTPTAVIADNLGFDTEGGARNFISKAKRKAQAAYTEAQG